MTARVTRRAVLGTIGSIAGAAVGLPAAEAQDAAPRINLRLLETSDLHMFVLDWDYYRVRPDPTVGLSKLATLIATARAEAPNTLLFDNGDFLQGNPLGDYIAEQAKPSAAAPHPMISVMAQLGYDAAGLGNHEFNYGLPFLEATLSGASFPFVCANVRRVGGAEFLPAWTILVRDLKDMAGAAHALRIGVVGFVPPQIMTWDKSRLEGRIESSDIVLSARRVVPALRARCDVLVALCHSGIRPGAWSEGAENASLHLATVPGIDVIMTGHAHRVFPGPDYASPNYAGVDGIDAVAGRLHGVPAVMPGFWGSHLGVVDLALRRDGDRWMVDNARVETRPIYRREKGRIEALAVSDAKVAASVAAVHKATLDWVEQPVGAVDAPVHSLLVWTGHDPASALINAAQTWYARPLLAGTAYAELPVLSSVAPFRAGYTPEGFIDIAKGPAALREIADLYIYSNNTVTAVKVTGAQIRDWLEFSARIFHTIVPAADPHGDPAATTPQALIDKRFPSYNFDIISGLTYTIDVTKPSRYGNRGDAPGAVNRIGDLMFEGKPLPDDRAFVVITNNYRADGGGNFPALAGADVVLRAPDANRDAILRYFKAHGTVAVPRAFPWTFARIGKPTPAYFDTGLRAAEHIAGTPGLTHIDGAEHGYARLQLTLS